MLPGISRHNRALPFPLFAFSPAAMPDFPTQRAFLTYTGIKLPLNLTSPLDEASLKNRNTYFLGHYDEQNRLCLVEKMVYGEVEMCHRYDYHGNGQLKSAVITDAEGEENTLEFDAEGQPA